MYKEVTETEGLIHDGRDCTNLGAIRFQCFIDQVKETVLHIVEPIQQIQYK